MRVVIGKQSRRVDTTADITAWAAGYEEIIIDLGTGDGRYVRHLATAHPTMGCIGVDLCHANLRETARRSPANALFVIADALAIPVPLHGMAHGVTIEFPWGSLLRGLLGGERTHIDGIAALGKPGLALDLDICLNAGALAEEGWLLEAGVERVATALRHHGISKVAMRWLGQAELRCLPTTWAKRLAFGRDPRAVRLEARFPTVEKDGSSGTSD